MGATDTKSKLLSTLSIGLFVTSLFFTIAVGSVAGAAGSVALGTLPNSVSQSFVDNATVNVDPPAPLVQNSGSAQALAVSASTLADTLNQVVSNVSWSSASANSWTAVWGPILNGQASSAALEAAMAQDISRGGYADALYVARLAGINHYSSPAIQAATLTALQQMLMSKSLPGIENDNSTLYGDTGPVAYEIHMRFPLWGYTYAKGTTAAGKWDLNTAFNDFAALYDKPPVNSAFGELLWADPQSNWARSYMSRYYDECAETMSVFLIFAEQGVPGALTYADKVWAGLQNHWTGSYYEYTVGSRNVECSMGEFAQIMLEYAQLKGGAQNVPNFSRVAQDLGYKLLANGWSSPGWSSAGILRHATTNSQTRLMETVAAAMALQEFYPSFTSAQQANYQNMLLGSSTAWQGLISSNVYFNGQFSAVGGVGPSPEGTICGAALLFLDGIVPVTGTLNIPAGEENYNDYRTQFLASQFQFNYAAHQITIPVNAGKLTFIYGGVPLSYTFPANGVYMLQFSSDWNTILTVNGVPVPPSAPSAPQNLAAVPGNGQVSLSWTAPLSDGGAPITNYRVYRGATSKSETLVATIGVTITTFTDTSVTNGQTYYYYVTAVNSAGESAASNEINAKPSAPLKNLTVAVKTDKTAYTRGATVTVTVTVKDSAAQTPLSGASVTLKTTRNGQTVYTDSATTDSTGTAKLTYNISRSASRGTYQASATVTLAGYNPGTGQTTFIVN